MPFMDFWETNMATRQARRRIASVSTSMKSIRGMLMDFVQGDSEECIRLLNTIRPKHVMGYVLGRELTTEEGTAYLSAIKDVPEHIRGIVAIGKAWQDCAQVSRKYLQDGGICRDDLVCKVRTFITHLDFIKQRAL